MELSGWQKGCKIEYMITHAGPNIKIGERAWLIDNIRLVRTNLVGFDQDGKPTDKHKYEFSFIAQIEGKKKTYPMSRDLEFIDPLPTPYDTIDACRNWALPMLMKFETVNL